MKPPRARLAFLGASAGVHLAIVGAIVALSWTEAPAPLPVIQVDLVQESGGAYRRALARALDKSLPVLEARIARATSRPLPGAPPPSARELAPEPRTRLLTIASSPQMLPASAAAKHPLPSPPPSRGRELPPSKRLRHIAIGSLPQADHIPATPGMNPLPPCGGELGRGECLDHAPFPLLPVVLAATAQAVPTASAALPQIDPAPIATSPGPLLRDGASRLLSMRPAGQATDASQHKVYDSGPHPAVYDSSPHPEEARRAVSKDAAVSAVVVATLPPNKVIQTTASPNTLVQKGPADSARRRAPGAEVVEDRRPVEARASSPPNRVQESAVWSVIEAIDSATLKTVRPPRRKPPRPAPKVTRAVKVEPEPASLELAPAQFAPAVEVARVLKTLKLKPAAEPAVAASPEVANDTNTGETVLAAAVATSNAAQAADSAPAFQGAALGNTAPRYPYAARVRGVEGDVLLRVVVLPSGKAADVTLRTTSGSALLDRAARDAVRNWRFRPARRAGQTVVGWVDVPVSFRLTD